MKLAAKRWALGAATACLPAVFAPWARAGCASPANAIEAENCLPGTPNSVWEPPASDPSIEGFAAAASVNPGSTISFKINTDAAAYTLSVYRMGYYGGDGARLVTVLSPSVPLPQVQPACLSDAATGLLDCGNWAVSASWNVPATATSGIYFVELERADTGGGNIFSFVVRDDASRSDIVYQAQDTTQQAYNNFGGNSLYLGNPAGRAYKVSFNRPPDNEGTLWDMFTFETAMIRWLEMNSYDMSYISGVDTDENGALLLNHKVFLTVAHDEYWSEAQRANVEAARDAGVNLAFFSGNTMYWKTRWENSIDGSNTDHRTLVCYKESTAGKVIDPDDPPVSTGLWDDPMFGPPVDGGRTQSLDTGAAGNVYGPDNRDDPMTVRASDGKLRFWRNTALANMSTGTVATYPQMLGYEWDQYLFKPASAYYPPGVIQLSSSALVVPDQLGFNLQGNYSAGQAVHRLLLYRAASGALVFDAGTMQWGWYLDDNHDYDVAPPAPDPNIQQATVNLFADMGVQPATLQSGLIPATKSTDATPPVSSILTAPQVYAAGALATISGTAVDFGGGVVGGVEVSTDDGADWFPAEGRESWTYSWTSTFTALVAPMSRATDDSGNIEGRTAGSNPAPALVSVSPSSAAVGGPGLVLTANGAGFISSSTVLWNGAGRATLFVSSAQLTAQIAAADLAALGISSVAVLNPGPGGGTTAVMAFAVGDPAPALLGLAPSSAAVGGAGFNLKVTGSDFVSSSTVLWNGQPLATAFVSSSALTAAVASGNLVSAATAAVTVLNPSPGGGASAAKSFVVADPLPVLLAVAPSSAAAGGAGFSLKVTGSDFVSGSTVLWDGRPLATAFVSSSALTAAVAAGDLVSAATAAVTVFNPPPGGGRTTARSFAVDNPAPVLLAVAPSSAAAGAAGFVLTAAGTGFVPDSSVRWNGALMATVFVSSVQLTAAVPARDVASGGRARISVGSPGPGGGTSPAKTFVVASPDAADLSGARVYPNPWRADRHQGIPIKIDRATSDSEMRVFTLSGRWVRTIALDGDGKGTWDVNDDSGRMVASGLYLYLITDGAGRRSRGTLAVIR